MNPYDWEDTYFDTLATTELWNAWNHGRPTLAYKKDMIFDTFDAKKEAEYIKNESDENLSELLRRREELANDGIEELSCPICGCDKLKAAWYINGLPYQVRVYPRKEHIEKAVLRYGCFCKGCYGEGLLAIDRGYFWPTFTKLATKDDILEARKFWERTCQKRLERQFADRKRRYAPMAEAFAEALVNALAPYLRQK